MAYATQVDVRAVAREVASDIAQRSFGASERKGALRTLREAHFYTADVEADCSTLQDWLSRDTQLWGAYGADDDHADLPVPIEPESRFEFPQGWTVKRASEADLLGGFAGGLEKFLKSRMGQGRGAGSSGMPKGRRMLDFRVETQTDGGIVHLAPCYFLCQRTVFGAPTTPVEGYIDPGMFRFGVQYPGHGFVWDAGVYSVPPQRSAQLAV